MWFLTYVLYLLVTVVITRLITQLHATPEQHLISVCQCLKYYLHTHYTPISNCIHHPLTKHHQIIVCT